MIKKLLEMIPGFSQAKLIALVGIIVAILTVASLGIWRYNSIVKELDTTKADKVKLELAVTTQQQTIAAAITTIDKWKQAQEKFAANVETMARTNQVANENVRRLNETLAQHDIGALSSRKPKLIENIINRGTARSMHDLMCASGSDDKDCSRGTRTTDNNTPTAKPNTY